MLAETGLSSGLLEIEMTETALMGSLSGHDNVVERLRARGLRIAIDDFGTGYSSLLYLRRFPLDRIKIAQEFVKEIGIETNDAAIVKAAIGLARELGIGVLAEGVDTADQLRLLHEWGCRQAQGFHLPRQCRRKMFCRSCAAAMLTCWRRHLSLPPGRGAWGSSSRNVSIQLPKGARRIERKSLEFYRYCPTAVLGQKRRASSLVMSAPAESRHFQRVKSCTRYLDGLVLASKRPNPKRFAGSDAPSHNFRPCILASVDFRV